MKVWLLQRSESTPHDGKGQQRLMRTGLIAEYLTRSGHSVIWWTSTFNHFERVQRYLESRKVEVRPGYDIYYLKGCGYRANMSWARMQDNLQVARQFAHLAPKEETPDILLCSFPTAELCLEGTKFGSLRGIPVVLDVRDLWPDIIIDLTRRLVRPLAHVATIPMRWRSASAFRKATAITGLTEAFVQWGLDQSDRARTKLDRVFPMGYKVAPQDDVQYWLDNGIDADDKHLRAVFVGTLGKTNDMGPVLDAAEILESRGRKIQFIICGMGENAEWVRRRAGQLDNVHFAGWVSGPAIRGLLRISDIGITPYVDAPNYVKNIPNKPAEYLSAGLGLAVSLGHGSLAQMVREEGCGFSYHGSAQELSGKLEWLDEERETLQLMQRNAAELFESRFRADTVYQSMVDYLEGLVLRNEETELNRTGLSGELLI